MNVFLYIPTVSAVGSVAVFQCIVYISPHWFRVPEPNLEDSRSSASRSDRTGIDQIDASPPLPLGEALRNLD